MQRHLTFRRKGGIIDAMKCTLLHRERRRRLSDATWITSVNLLNKENQILSIQTPGGHYRYAIQEYIDSQRESGITTLCYCRVSGKAQANALASQAAYMREKFPEAAVIQDFGSDINFKCKIRQRLLERILRGDKRRSVGAHRDRLARFGGEVI